MHHTLKVCGCIGEAEREAIDLEDSKGARESGLLLGDGVGAHLMVAAFEVEGGEVLLPSQNGERRVDARDGKALVWVMEFTGR